MDERKSQLSNILSNLADELDIPETKFTEAEERYQAVGKWLGEDPRFAQYYPRIYPQGSFLLGTMVKPITDEDGYDIDLVFNLELSMEAQNPQDYKAVIGERLRAHGKYAQMLEPEGRRCWTLQYAESTKFHLDVLPAIPHSGLAIGITDKTEPGKWLTSNPRGYAEWFKNKMKTIFLESRRIVAMAAKVDINDVPEYRVKTPLQRAIQILKRHRDIMFQNDPEHKPISMIITTLAAKAYNNEANLVDALLNIVDGMPQYIENRGGVKWVANPVNPEENFADKWAEKPEKEAKFRSWLVQVKAYIEQALRGEGIHKIAEISTPVFGKKVVNEAMVRVGKAYAKDRNGGALKMASGTGTLGAAGTTTVRKHTFYGE